MDDDGQFSLELYQNALDSKSIPDEFKIYFDQTIDLNLIKENLIKRQNKCEEELNKVSQRLTNKNFVDKAPKNIVDQEKNNYNDLKNDIQKITLTIESL